MSFECPEPGEPREPRPHRRLTDPRAMRAVAHPTRLALLEAFDVQEPLTATEAAAILGESPTNCAFHLRTLAKYGFVEEADPGGSPGRRRPWRRVHLGFTYDEDHADTDAAQALSVQLWAQWLRRLQTVLTARPGFSPEQRRVTGSVQTLAHVTPAEAEALTAQALTLLDRHRDRLEDPALRPADSIPVEVLLFTYPRDVAK